MKVDINAKKIEQVNNSDKIIMHNEGNTKRKKRKSKFLAKLFSKKPSSKIKSFIVHGHDNELKKDLKDFLQNKLGFTEPILLHQQPNQGLTVIEKLEKFTEEVDIVFILLTPDDLSINLSGRARQNVVFELGYFFGKFGRKSGRIILLTKGNLELPSDLNGILTIDVSGGINSAAQDLRQAAMKLVEI